MTSVKTTAVIVLHAFGPYTRGEIISDPSIIAAILNGGNAKMVVPTIVQRPFTTEREASEG